jgi:hypothetical protein
MEDKFKELQEKFPNHSSLVLFGRLIRMTPKENWNQRKVSKYFNSLVDKDDYLPSEKKMIISWLVNNK